MEKAMAPHSSTLAWKIPWLKEPGGLQSVGSLRVGHDWATSLSLFTFMHCRRKWQPTPVFLPGESQGRGSLVGCCLWVAQNGTRLKWLSSTQEGCENEFFSPIKNQARKSTDTDNMFQPWIPNGNHYSKRIIWSLSMTMCETGSQVSVPE